MTIRKRCSLFFFIFFALFSLTVYSAGTSIKPEFTFYFLSHGGPGDPYWQSFINGANDQAKILNVKLVYIYPQREVDIGELIRQLNSTIASHPDGVGLTIHNVSGFSVPLLELKKQKIPVIAFDTVPDPSIQDPRIPYICYVGENSYNAGQSVAESTDNKFKLVKGDRIVVINHEAGNPSLALRFQGITDVLGAKGVLVDQLAIPGDDPVQSQAIIQNYIAKYPNVKVLITLGPPGYIVAGKVIASNKLIGKVGFVGWDISKEAIELIRNGAMAFTANEQPYYIGATAVFLLYMNVKYGFQPPPTFNTGLGQVDKDNLENWEKLVESGKG